MTTQTQPKTVGYALPLMPCIAEDIIRELMNVKPLWSRKEIITEVSRIHESRGGLPGTQCITAIVKKSLRKLREDGEVITPSYSMWSKPDGITQDRDRKKTAMPRGKHSKLWRPDVPMNERMPPQRVAHSTGNSLDQNIETVDVSKKITVYEKLPAQKEIGKGVECIYMYYMPTYKELAELKGESVWPCKIGKTGVFAADRIKDQGATTAFAETPVLALVINTNHASMLERVIHSSLSILNLKLNGPGSEWYSTSPEIVESWYCAYMETLKVFDGTESVLSGEKNAIS